MEAGNLSLENRDGIALVTVNRPEKMNALNCDLFKSFHVILDAIESDESIRAVIITGKGEKAFVAGADIQELAAMNAVTGKETSQIGQAVFNRIEQSTQPVVAAVNGFALGGGCELALCCHIRVCSPNAQFGLPEVGLGIIPGYGGTQRLSRLVGKGRAMASALTGEFVKADDALQWGLVSKIFEAENFLESVESFVRKMILSKGPLALRMAIEAVNASTETDLASGQVFEANAFGLLSATDDMHEGMNAFLEKRKPEFKNA